MGGLGRLVALEGIDGSGKTTQARLLAGTLGAVLTHEPGATEIGAGLRSLLLDSGGSDPGVRAEALMMAADRAEHVRLVVAPALSSGRWVVCDRFSASTLAYQGYGRGLALDDLRWLVAFATDGLECDLNVLVDIPVALAGERLGNAGSDRLESSGVGFYERVAIGYREMALADPAGWAVVDGTGSVEEVAGAIMSVVVERIGDPRGAASPGDADQELGGSL